MLNTPPTADAKLDAGETACGDLILLISKHMKSLQPRQILHVVGYDRGAAEDIPAWCRMTQNKLVYQTISEDSSEPSHFYIERKDAVKDGETSG